MPGTITIDIEAKLIDNAMAGLQALDAKIDELNSKQVVIKSEFDGSGGGVAVEETGKATDAFNKTEKRFDELNQAAEKTYSDIGTAGPALGRTNYSDIGRDMGRSFAQEASKATETVSEASVAEDRSYLGNILDNAAERIYERQDSGAQNNSPLTQSTEALSEDRSYLKDVIDRSVDALFPEESSREAESGGRYALPEGESPEAWVRANQMGYNKSAADYVYGTPEEPKASTAAAEAAKSAASIAKTAVEGTQSEKGSNNAGTLMRAFMTATGGTKYGTLGSQMAKYLGLDPTSWKGIAGGLATAVGMIGTVEGMQKGVANIIDSYAADNSVDAARTRATGKSQVALTGIGALAGAFIPGIGPIVGASIGGGLGSLVGNIFGEDIGNKISGFDKSYAEYQEEGLKKYFGSFKMSDEQIEAVARNILGQGLTVKESNGFSSSLESATGLRQELQSMSDEVKIRGSQFQIYDNLGLENSKEDLEAFGETIKSFGENAEQYLSTTMFKDLAAADTIFGEGNPYVQNIADGYTGKITEIKSVMDSLGSYLEGVEKNGGKPDATTLTTYQRQIQELIGETSGNELQNQLDVIDLMSGSGAIGKDSFDSVMSSLNESYNTAQEERANELVSLIRNGSISKEAAVDSMNEYSLLEGGKILGQQVGLVRNQMPGFEEGTTTAVDNTREFFGGWANAANEGRSVQYTKDFLGGDEGKRRERLGFTEDDKAGRTDIMKSAYEKFDISGYESRIAKANEIGNYAGNEAINNLLSAYEIGARGNVEGATDKYLGAMMATDAQFSTMMESFKQIPDIWGKLPQGMKDTYDMFRTNMGFNNQTQPEQTPSETTAPTAEQNPPASEATPSPSETTAPTEEGQNGGLPLPTEAPEESPQPSETTAPTAEATAPPSETTAPASEETAPASEITDKSATDLGQSVMSAINQGLSGDIKGLDDIGQNLMGKIAESMSEKNLKGMDTSIGESLMNSIGQSIGDLDMSEIDTNFGEGLMGKIAESFSPDNLQMDTSIGESLMASIAQSLGELDMSQVDTNFGEGLMSKISESFSPDNLQMDTSIGESLMNSISQSIGSIDMSQIDTNFGEGLMSKIAESFSTENLQMDVSIGESLMAAINSSLGEIDLSGADIDIGQSLGQSLMGKISESLSSLSEAGFEGIDLSGIGASISASISSSLEGVQLGEIGSGLQEQISASLSELTVDASITVNATYVLGDTGTGLQEQIAASLGSMSVDTTVAINATYAETTSPTFGPYTGDAQASVSISASYNEVTSPTFGPYSGSATATVDVTVSYNIKNPNPPLGGKIGGFAKGTDYVTENMMATINDEPTADPRELVVHNGRGYLFEGNDVQVPLSVGDRVFTASQTKRMLGGSYAEGYDNNLSLNPNYSERDNEIYKANAGESSQAFEKSGSGKGSVSFGSPSVSIGNINLSVEGKGDGRDIMDEIRDRADEVGDVIAGAIEKRLGDEMRNMPTRIS